MVYVVSSFGYNVLVMLINNTRIVYVFIKLFWSFNKWVFFRNSATLLYIFLSIFNIRTFFVLFGVFFVSLRLIFENIWVFLLKLLLIAFYILLGHYRNEIGCKKPENKVNNYQYDYCFYHIIRKV